MKGWKTIFGAFTVGLTKIAAVTLPMVGVGAFGDKAQTIAYGVGTILLGTGVAGKLEDVATSLRAGGPPRR